MSGALDQVESRSFTVREVRLESGAVLPELTLAYETYGTLAPDGRNAVLGVHGYSANHHMAGRYRPGGAAPGVPDDAVGSWDKLIGPGKAIDTSKLFVVTSNMLGSSFGSTGPKSRNPASGQAYGPDFPDITLGDIVAAQKRLLDHLGVKHLVAVAGPSYGGYQAFQWAVQYPDFMHGIIAAVSSPKGNGTPESVTALLGDLAQDPNWRGGRYHDKGGIFATMLKLRVATLKRYGIDAQLKPQYPDAAAREAAIRRTAEPWARAFDGHSLVALRKAAIKFDARPQLDRIRAKVLYVISRTDDLFPPSIVPDVMARLEAAKVDARYFPLDSELGHLAPGPDGEKWAPALKEFMAELMAKP